MCKKHPSRIPYLIFVAAILFAVGMIYRQAKVFPKQNVSLQWPNVTGKIVQSQLDYGYGRHSRDSRANIVFRYQVNETRHVSHQISLWSADLGSYNARAFVFAHPTGSDVKVYYDPENPENSVLVPGANENGSKLLIGFGCLSLVMSISGVIFRFRREPRLYALLNAPDAQTRTITLKRMDIEKGVNVFINNFLVAAVFTMFAVVFLSAPLLTDPVSLSGTRPTTGWEFIVGIVCAIGMVFFGRRGIRLSRSAQCPLCGNLLNKKAFSKCEECGTRILFEGEAASAATVDSSG